MRDSLLSIVVPVYNVEKYIGKCLYSIIKQSYRNIEVIVIDDGSTDGSGAICDEIAAEDNRIKVVHTSNKGVSAARNLGISLVNGQYLAFVDADDYIEENMYQVLLDDIQRYEADISMCNVYHRRNRKHVFQNEDENIKIYTGIEMLEHFYGNDYVLAVVVWNKVYKRELFQDISFPEGLTREDEFVMHKVIYYAKSISFRNEGLYHYLTHKGSITRQKDLGRLNRLIAVEDRLLFFRDKEMPKLYYLSLLRLLNDSARCYFYVFMNFHNKEALRKIQKRFMSYYDEVDKMKEFFKENKICPKLLFVKYFIIKIFYFICNDEACEK